jgi:predicted nucleic acid-binding protein
LDAARQVMERYDSLSIGLADASNVVLANGQDTLDVLTLDERHFRVLSDPVDRPFRLLPAHAN